MEPMITEKYEDQHGTERTRNVAVTEMTLNRDFTIGSTLGHRIRFAKGEVTRVPDIMIEEVIAIGAERVDGKDHFAELAKQTGKVQPMSPDARYVAVQEALKQVIDKNNRDDFTAAGNPSLKALSNIAGFKVDKNEQRLAVKARNESIEAA
jgi:hypothetical protein